MNKQRERNIRHIFEQQPQGSGGQRPHGGVGQDKNALRRVRTASRQPVTRPASLRTPPTRPPGRQSQPAGKTQKTQRKRTYLMLWVEPVVKAELERRAQRNGLSLSAAGSALLKRALQENIDMEYGALLEPIIRQEIRRQMGSFSSRIALLLVRVAFAGEQTRSLVTNILARQPGVSAEVLDTLLDQSAQAAKSKITAKTPQLERIIKDVENWFRDRAGGKEGAKEEDEK